MRISFVFHRLTKTSAFFHSLADLDSFIKVVDKGMSVEISEQPDYDSLVDVIENLRVRFLGDCVADEFLQVASSLFVAGSLSSDLCCYFWHWFQAVKARMTTTDEMFEPLKQTIELLKTYDQEMPEDVHKQLEVNQICTLMFTQNGFLPCCWFAKHISCLFLSWWRSLNVLFSIYL